MNKLLKFWAYLFHFSASIFLLSLAVTAARHHDEITLQMLPFNQERLVSRISIIALLGLISLFLAYQRIFEIVFPLWSLAILGLLTWGFFVTSYSFQGPIGLGAGLLLLFGAFLAFLGSFAVLIPERRKRW